MEWVVPSWDTTIEEDRTYRTYITTSLGMMNPRLFPEEAVEVRWVGRVQHASLVENWLYLAGAVAVREDRMDLLMGILQSCSSLLLSGACDYYDPCILEVCELQ
jgi:hypothetical protein